MSAVVRERCRALLPPGTEIRYLFPATAGSVVSFARKPFIVVVTAENVIMLECSWLSHDRPKAVQWTYNRGIRLGPVDTALDPTFTIDGTPFQTWDEYVPVIVAADAEVRDADFGPPDPLPDL
ncbi:hypothetical protein [Umezawaea sp. Da 62-37]|uniref:hypothetical protein n=1 Tax=Umezawaea sp. Da 62-37 TaxID=3075927 RepID=UPI0028F6DED5|nr:hypothetical protein [Umezawaea sp. Da 62-37]WNV91742.1 hypothetical protein RM788_26880 [Umezawaea sp. Da 62-37]